MERGSIYFKHFCSGESKYFDIFGPGGTKIAKYLKAVKLHLILISQSLQQQKKVWKN